MRERASHIYALLKRYPHNGFPVVVVERDAKGRKRSVGGSNGTDGQLVGFMLRHQLITILKKQLFEEDRTEWLPTITQDTFLSEYPRYPSIEVSGGESDN